MKTTWWTTCAVLAIAGLWAARDCMAAVKEFRLENGLRVMLRPVSGASDVAVVVLYDVGELHDPPGKSGLGHLVEHIYVTAGTPTIPQRTADQFMNSYRKKVFGQLVFQCNAQTGDDYTVVAGVVASDRIEAELQQAAERMGDLRIEQSDLDREVPRMLEEVRNMFERFPPLAGRNNVRERLHPRPNGGRHGGVPDQIKQFTLDDVRSHWRNYYKASNATLVITGNIDLKTVEDKVRKAFANGPAGRPLPPKPADLPPAFGETKLPLAHSAGGSRVCIGYLCPPPNSKLFPSFVALVARLLSDATKLSKGPAESPVAFMPLDDPGTVYVTSKVGDGETSDKTVKRLTQFVADAVHTKDLAATRAAAGTYFSFLLGTKEPPDSRLTNIYGVAFGLARRKRLGIDGLQLAKELEHLQQTSIDQCANEYFANDRRVVVVMEP